MEGEIKGGMKEEEKLSCLETQVELLLLYVCQMHQVH